MTVTNTNLRNDYTGNGATTVYAFTFVAIYEVGSAKYSLKVITTDTIGVESVKTQGTDYTVALSSNGTGTITFAIAPTSGHKISILPDMTLTQETDYIKSGSDKFPAESHEKALDKLTLIAKQFFELFKRTIKLPNNSLLSEITIPVQTSNANKAIVVNSSGSGLDAKSLLDINTYPITAFAETLLDDTNASEARQTLGLVIGTNVQAYNANLAALASLTGSANKIPYFTGAGAMGLADLFVKAPAVTVYSSGSGNYTVPAGTSYLRVQLLGGGGGGAGGNSGGAAPAASNGGNTTFNAITANGGSGAPSINGGAGGTGGAGTAAYRINGNPGRAGYRSGIGSDTQWNGTGGNSPFGLGQGGWMIPNSNGTAGTGFGSGGGGGGVNATNCGGGGGSGEYAEFYIQNPTGTYAYSVGAAGAGSVSTTSGGSGASGIIIVSAY